MVFIAFTPFTQEGYGPGYVDNRATSLSSGEEGGGFQAVLTNVAQQILFEADGGAQGDRHVSLDELSQQRQRYEDQYQYARQYLAVFSPTGFDGISLLRALGLKIFSARFMQSYFQAFASANAQTDLNTIEPTDVTALNKRDNNTFDISWRDVNNLGPAPTTAPPSNPLQFIQR